MLNMTQAKLVIDRHRQHGTNLVVEYRIDHITEDIIYEFEEPEAVRSS
jgi:hypothetical protein